jgi:non-homologous end joining protein Ku
MAPRPYWKGHLKLSLVSCPIALYPAVDASERVSFRQINRSTGNRLRQRLVDTVTGETIEASDKARGFEVAENQFVVVENEDLEQAREKSRVQASGDVTPASQVREDASKRDASQLTLQKWPEGAPAATHKPRAHIPNPRTIEIEHFIRRTEIDARYLQTPYYITPRASVGQEAFAVIRDAMAEKDVVGLGRVVLSNRERPIILTPLGAGLRGITLRYAHEIRNEAEYFADIPELVLPAKMQELAEHIVETRLAQFDPTYLEDRYRTAVMSMLRHKAQLPHRAGAVMPSRENVIDLMEVLQRSLTAEQSAPRGRQKRRARGAALASKAGSSKRAKMSKPPRSKRNVQL